MRRDSSRRSRVLPPPPDTGAHPRPLHQSLPAGGAPRFGASTPVCLAAAVAVAGAAGEGLKAIARAVLWRESWGLGDREGPPSQSAKAAPAAAEVGLGHHLTPAQASGLRGVPAAPPVGALSAARSPRRRRTEEDVGPPRWVGGRGGGWGGGGGYGGAGCLAGARYGGDASSASEACSSTSGSAWRLL